MPSLGLESGTVRLVPYDPAWPAMFTAEVARLRAVLGPDLPLELDHMGSTAVPGLVAKPILDLLGGYPPHAPVDSYILALIRAGYVHRGEQGMPGRQFFRRGEPRAYHLHLASQHSAFWREHLAFRDGLRGRPAVRDAYAPSNTASVPARGLRAGRYTLTLVGTTDPWRGQESAGTLTLWPTSPTDRSPRTRERAQTTEQEEPFYGATDVDFSRVGAPVSTADTLAPPPTSEDPVYPGVLVLVTNWEYEDLPSGYVLTVGTLSNRRADRGWLDGAGIGMWIRTLDERQFSGEWREWGILRDGRGYFCAMRIE